MAKRINVEEARKRAQGIVTVQQQITPVQQNLPKQPTRISTHDIMNKDDEDAPAIWEPSDEMEDSFKSLIYFHHFNWNDKKSTKKEIKESFQNFDEWLDDSVANIIREERDKENKLFS